MKLPKTPAVSAWALVWIVGACGSVRAGTIASVGVTPDPLITGQEFTVQVRADEECTGTVRVDLRPTSTQILRLDLAFSAEGAGSWVGEAHGTLPPGLNPAVGAVATINVVVYSASGAEARSTLTVPLQNAQGVTLDLSPDPVAPGGRLTASLTAGEQFAGTMFVDLRPTSPRILRFSLASSFTGSGAWQASVQTDLPPNLTPPAGATITIRAVLTFTSGRSDRLTREISLRGTPPDTTPPDVAILSPSDGDVFASGTVSVSGTVSMDAVSVTVNGVDADLAAGAWSATVPLAVEGNNAITAEATDAAGNKGSAMINVRRDWTSPDLDVVSPADGAVVNTRQPTIQITYDDAGAGLDLNTLVLELNGTDVTAASSVGPAGATYQPGSSLPTGENQIRVTIDDQVGNRAILTTHFTVAVFRAIADCAPTTGEAPLTVNFRTRGEFTGGSIVRYRWDFENDGVFDTSDSVARDLTHTYVQPGTYVAVLEVQNNFGDLATDSCAITVTGNPPEVFVQLVPSNGAVPLEVQFLGYGLKRYGSISRVEFDFEGDGTYDLVVDEQSRPKPDAIRFYIQHADCSGEGVFSFFLNDQAIGSGDAVVGCECNSLEPMYEVTDPDALAGWDEQASNTLGVSWEGYWGLYVSYIRAELVYQDQVVEVCMHDLSGWDCTTRALCNSDYTDDPFTVTTVLGSNEQFGFAVSHTYEAEGTFNAIVRVTDNEGFTATASAIATVIRAGPRGSPSVTAIASPSAGFAPVLVNFNGSAIDDGTIVLWEWDFDGNGVFDFSSPTSPATSHTYTEARHYAAALRATDNDGLMSVDTVELSVDMNATLSVPYDTFNPSLSQQATVRTWISAPTQIRVTIKDRQGNTVRDLVEGFRQAGTYDDSWDGTDSQGLPLAHGPYYAVLEYRVGSEIRVLDLTASTGGTRYNPPRNSLYSQSTFRPYDDEQLTINFNVNQGPSEILAFIGLYSTDTRFVTLLEREPFGAGNYQIKWDGLDAAGNFAKPPPGDRFLFGIWGYTMPDNTVFLISAPSLSNVTIDPNFFDPSAVLAAGTAMATATFDLDKAANVELTVTRLDNGRVLRRMRQNSVAAGTGRQIKWDGRADSGILVDKGDYRLGLVATDSTGSQSITRYALVRVFY